MSRMLFAISLSFLFACLAPAHARQAIAIDCGKVPPGNTILPYAARELSGYLTQVTGTKPETRQGATGSIVTFLIGGPAANPRVAKLVKAGQVSLGSIAGEKNDSYIVKSAKLNGNRYVVLAGNNDHSTLYAVYHYLERLVHVGFFFDGEYIPRKGASELPVRGIDIVEKSRVLHRSAGSGMRGVAGLKWRVSTFWNKHDWHTYISYLLKKRWSWSSVGGGWIDWYPEEWAKFDRKVLGVGRYSMGIYPDDYAIAFDKDLLKYGRERGLAFYTFMRYDSVGLKNPDDPSGRFEPIEKGVYDATIEYWRQHVRTFGSDGWNAVVYSSEDPKLTGKNERAIALGYNAWQKVDPGSMIETETWGPPSRYTEEEWDYFDRVVPQEVIVEDCHSGTLAERLKNYGGRRWIYSVVWPPNGAPDSWMLPVQTPKMKDVLTNYESLLRNKPELRQTLTGFRWRPESLNVCAEWAEWMADVAWNPDTADIDSFFKTWAINRVGERDAPTMERAIRRALETTDNVNAFHRSLGGDANSPHVPTRKTPSPLDPSGYDLHDQEKSSKLLDVALKEMLSLEGTQAGNVLWRNTVVEVFKQLWIRKWHVRFGQMADIAAGCKTADGKGIRPDAKWPAEPAKEMLARSREMLAMYDTLAQVLARDPRYSLRATLEDAYSVPGMIKSLKLGSYGNNWDFLLNHYYRHFSAESVHWLFRHQMGVKLREALEAFGVPEQEIPPVPENWTEEKILTSDDVWQYRSEPVIPEVKKALQLIQ